MPSRAQGRSHPKPFACTSSSHSTHGMSICTEDRSHCPGAHVYFLGRLPLLRVNSQWGLPESSTKSAACRAPMFRNFPLAEFLVTKVWLTKSGMATTGETAAGSTLAFPAPWSIVATQGKQAEMFTICSPPNPVHSASDYSSPAALSCSNCPRR